MTRSETLDWFVSLIDTLVKTKNVTDSKALANGGDLDYSLRPATRDDLPEILKELQAFSDFFDSEIPLYGDDEYAKKFVSTLIDSHVFLVAISNDSRSLMGFVSGMIAPHIFNPKIMTLTEVFWWVKPEHRGSRAGRDLIEEFILWGKENVDWIITTLEENSPVNDSVFLNRGFKPKERSFIMEVN